MKNGKTILLTLLLSAIVFLSYSFTVFADDCDNIPSDQANIESKIACLSGKVSQLSSQANTLKNQIAQFDYQIKLTTLKIQDTQAKIELLGGRIDQLETSLNDLTTAFSSRAVETYKLSKVESNFIFLFSAADLGEAVSRFDYLKKIQESDRQLLVRLQEAQTTYRGQKEDQETLQDDLKKQQTNLSSQKAAKAALLAATQSDEKKYQSLLSQAKAQFDRFRRFTTSQGGATILSNQTRCDSWGCYYNQRDSQWGNMYLGGTSYLMKDSGCFITSVAMLANHAGKNILPSDIAQLSAAVTSGGDLRWSFSVNGVNVSIASAASSELDQRLNNGPVIAGLHGWNQPPDHFIVVLRKEGDKYIMHDPFLENGNNRPLTDRYSVSDITTLRLVSF